MRAGVDVVVAGDGPAGSATAGEIARAGFRVLVVERRVAVGRPALCSGLVSERALREAGLSNGLVLNELKGVRVHSTSGRSIGLGGDRVYALAIDRAAFDEELAEQARRAGAEILPGTKLATIARDGDLLRLTVGTNGHSREVSTRLLVGADGVGSTVAEWLGSHRANGAVRAIGAEGELECGEVDRAQVFVGSAVAPGWFGWIIPLGDGRVRIGTGDGGHSGVPLRQLLERMLAAFPEQFRGIRLGRAWAKPIPIYSPVRTHGDNVLLVGDAARQVKPTSGGGIYTALVGARHCARVAIEALARGDFSESFLSRYDEGWKGELGPELEKGVDLRRAFLSLSDREVDELLAIFGRPALRGAISRLGDIDAPSPMMEQLVRLAPALRLFLHVPLHFPSRWASDLLASLVGSGARR